MSLSLFLLALGLALRVTRFVVDDSLTEPIRMRLLRLGAGTFDKDTFEMRRTRRNKFFHWFYQLTDCPWCFGVWAAGFSFWFAYLWGDQKWFIFTAAALSASWLIGFASMYAYKVQSET